MDDLRDRGPSNSEFFDFLGKELAFSVFQRSGSVLTSFKTTIELAFVPEGTAEGPAEGLLFEGTAPMSYEAWSEFVAGFALTSIESRHDVGGERTRAYRAIEEGASSPTLPAVSRAPSAEFLGGVAVREDLLSERAHYAWIGPGTAPDAMGRFSLHVRRIACRGSDKGLSAQSVYLDKLRLYRRRGMLRTASSAPPAAA